MPPHNDYADDTQIIQGLHAGDRNALKALYEIYYEPLYRFLWRKTRHEDTALDLVQDVFIRVWESRSRLDETQSIKAYLYRIAGNLAIDHLRHKITARSEDIDDMVQEPAHDPQQRYDLRHRIHNALEKLPEDIKTVFTLNRFDALKYAEIAEMLNISVKTVESRMSKALKLLRTSSAGRE